MRNENEEEWIVGWSVKVGESSLICEFMGWFLDEVKKVG